jgi:hypothetical protein
MRTAAAISACALAALVACSSTTPPASSGQLNGVSGITATSAGDRDLLFVANAGGDELRALNICTASVDGGQRDPNDPCPLAEDYQFVAGPIRLFADSIQTNDRPVRLAGARLSFNGGNTGAVLVAGAENALRVVDAKNIVDQEDRGATAVDAGIIPLAAPATDVVAANQLDGGYEIPAASVFAFAVTSKSATAPAQLVVLSVHADPVTGAIQLSAADIVGSCSLDPVQPRRIALVPGRDDVVYIADGAGDGAVRVNRADVPAGAAAATACPFTRLSAGGRPLRSLAVSPAFTEQTTFSVAKAIPHPAGDFLVVAADDSPLCRIADPLSSANCGGILILRTDTFAVVSQPTVGILDPVVTPMEPLVPRQAFNSVDLGSLPRDVAFLQPFAGVTPFVNGVGSSCLDSSRRNSTTEPCSELIVGGNTNANKGTTPFDLLAVVSTSDGGSYFVDVVNRRFVDDLRDLPGATLIPAPTVDLAGLLTPAAPSTELHPATLTPVAVADTAHPPPPGITIDGWLNPGVTRRSRWRAVFHSPLSGLERRGGSLTASGTGTYNFTVSPAGLLRYTTAPLLQLSPGDAVALIFTSDPASRCPDLASETTPLRIELPIVSITDSVLELGPVPDTATAAGFHPAASCFASPVGAVAEVRVANGDGGRPWLVYENQEIRGRARNGEVFVGHEPRTDYPGFCSTASSCGLSYSASQPPIDIGVAFIIAGDDPPLQSVLSFGTNSDGFPTTVRDSSLVAGLAGSVFVYRNAKVPNLVFTSVTGGNGLLQSNPLLLNSFGGIVSYR